MQAIKLRAKQNRLRATIALLLALILTVPAAYTSMPDAYAVTHGNGVLVYSPSAGSSFNPEGGDPAGTTYAKIISLKNSDGADGDLLVTFDQLVLVNGVQVYPIYRSTNGGLSWSHVTDVVPSNDFPSLTRTAQPFLYEVPENTGSLAAGTILLGGMLMPEDRSSSHLVVYASTDGGNDWDYLSTIDVGGPAVYDPSPTSTTSTVWEPSFAVDAYGGLVAYYSDERQKADGVLQAVSYRRSTDGGQTWGPIQNVSAPPNSTDRPGMITVTKLPDSSYLATFEVVNRPSQNENAAPVYFKKSPDGLDWGDEASVGEPVLLADGRGIGSSPFLTWAPSGGPAGMLIIATMWSLDENESIDGGQNLYVNYNLGEGPWERLPMPVTSDATESHGGNFSGFAQGLAVSSDGRTLYQATNVENLTTELNDIRVGSLRLDAQQYEAELATINNASVVQHPQASNGSKVGNINLSDSYVEFAIDAPTSGTYDLSIRYANGSGVSATHTLTINGGMANNVLYSPTADWGRYQWSTTQVTLDDGQNLLRLTKGTGYTEIDTIHLNMSAAMDPQFQVINRNSGKLLEILGASMLDGAPAGQWGLTGHPTQVWRFSDQGSNLHIKNTHSRKLLEIPAAAVGDGVEAAQWGPTGHLTQEWHASTAGGWWQFENANSGKMLEIDGCLTTDGAAAQQWTATGAPCQDWVLVREGIQ